MYPNPYIRPGLFSRGLAFTRNINWGGLLDGTQKTLGVINQAIPIVYQVKPILNNAKTMFRIANEMQSPSNNQTSSIQNNITTPSTNNRPIFYM